MSEDHSKAKVFVDEVRALTERPGYGDCMRAAHPTYPGREYVTALLLLDAGPRRLQREDAAAFEQVVNEIEDLLKRFYPAPRTRRKAF